MVRLMTWMTVLAVVGVFASPALGALATDYLSMKTVSKIEDDDWEMIVGSLNQAVDEGDIFVGCFEAQKIHPDATKSAGVTPTPGTGAPNFTAVFALKVKSTSGGGGSNYVWQFEPLSDVEWGVLVTTYSNMPVRANSGTITVVYSDTNSTALDGWVGADGDINGTIGRAAEGTYLWEFGFTPGGNEFWTATAPVNVITQLTSVNELNWWGGLNVTDTAPIVAGLTLVPHDFKSFGNKYQLELTGSSEGELMPDGTTGPWLKTDTDLYVHAVPEPSSLLIWGCVFGCLGLASLRRRAA